MQIIIIAVGIVLLVLVVGIAIAGLFYRLDQMVNGAKSAVETKAKGYSPAKTMGFKIQPDAAPDVQLQEARLLAAQQAAALPRGANMRIGHAGESNLTTAYKGVKEDPMTAVKIATHHGWDGVRTGPTAVAAAAPAARGAAAAPAAKSAAAPAADYALIPITDSMSPEEKRKATIANAKAKSKAMKAAKGAGGNAGGEGAEESAAVAAVAAPAAVAPAAAAAAAGIPLPNLIEITPNMSPDEVRKARIQNSKEQSKYNKALKAAGIEIGGEAPVAAEPAAMASAGVATAPAAPAPSAADLAGIPKPNLIEITPTMSPEDVRRARVQNSKEQSRYNKALKEAGIDPKSVQS